MADEGVPVAPSPERAPLLPEVVVIDDFSLDRFPMIRKETATGYKVLELPAELQALFDRGVAAIVINSLALAESFPDEGGRASGKDSLPPHQDIQDDDPNMTLDFLVLSKRSEAERGSSTLIMSADVATELQTLSEHFFKDPEMRAILKQEGSYDARFAISEEQYWRCFDSESGFDEVAAEFAGADADDAQRLRARTSLVSYLVRGQHANALMAQLRAVAGNRIVVEDWKTTPESGGGKVVIINNRMRTGFFHARDGGNEPPLFRNFCVAAR